jgi:hypothetical protein
MLRVNLFLIGAAKSGTTALSEVLSHHKEIASMAIKEPGHFCTDVYEKGFSKAYDRLLHWSEKAYFERDFQKRHMSFIKERENYDKLVESASNSRFILDASTAYLPSKKAAENVAGYNSEAKIIICLRNPITRAYSHFNMAVKYGKEKRSFLEALKDEAELNARWGWEECYLELGMYAPQIKRWFQHFDQKQIHIVWHDQMLINPINTLQEVQKFLGLSEPLKLAEEIHGAEVPKNKFAKMLVGFGPRAASILPAELKQKAKNLLLEKPKVMNDAARSFLLRYFAASIEELEVLLNRDLTHWKEI